jgi:LEA14-like dessication related protein
VRTSFKIFTALLLLSLCSCRDLRDVQVTGIKGFTVNKISTEGIDGNILLGIKNPNNFGFSIFRSEFDVMYSGVYLGKAKLSKRVRIKANAEENYSFNLKSDFKNTNLLDIAKLLNGASFRNKLEVKGDLRAGKLFVYRSFPVDVQEQIKLR